ncbi:MAG: hypothetical protein CMH41_02395 [Micrococcales bacterium]|nr:hypothetical protein [Micrococcales bacterium]
MSHSASGAASHQDGEPGSEDQPSFSRRLLGGVVVTVLMLTLPAVVGYLVGGQSISAATGAAEGSLVGLLIAISSGQRRVLLFLPALAIAALAGYGLYGTWWWVLACISLAAITGWQARNGLHLPFALTAILFCVARPNDQEFNILIFTIAIVFGALWGLFLSRKIGAPKNIAFDPVENRSALLYAGVLTLAVSVACLMMMWLDNPQGYWLPMTVFILAIPKPGVNLAQRATHRLLGTLIGVTLAYLTILIGSPDLLSLALASGLLVVAFVVREPDWLNQAVISAAVVLVMTPIYGSEVGGSRLLLTGLAALISVGALVLWTRWSSTDPVVKQNDEDIKKTITTFADARDSDD